MNKKLFWTLGLALITSLSMQAQDDDLYFTPSKKKSQGMNATVTSVRSNQQSASIQSSRPALAVYNNNSRDEDEYNRRDMNYAGAWQTGGGAEEDSLVAQVDTVYTTSPDMYDPETDFIYSRRLLRFHSPRFGFALSSPYYWDLVYGYGVYNYLYDPFYWDLYDPFYWDYGWSYSWHYGWGFRPWYSSFYGWHTPYYAWDHWGAGPYWHGAGPGPDGRRYNNTFSRGRLAENRYATSSVGRSTTVAAANGTRNSFSSRTENTIRTSAARTTSAARNNNIVPVGRVGVSGNSVTPVNRVGVSTNNNRTSTVRPNTQQVVTRTQTPTNNTTQQRVATPTTQQRVTTPTTQQRVTTPTTQQRTTVSVPSTTSSFSSGGAARSSFGGGGGASSGGNVRSSGGRR